MQADSPQSPESNPPSPSGSGGTRPRIGPDWSKLPVRFSLRTLLVALTLFAIGFPIWYRWPYREVELIYRNVNGQPDKTKPPVMRVVSTWRRNWGGKPYKQGESIVYRADGGIIARTEYRRDKRNGPKKSFRDDGSLQWIEQFEDDVRVGMTYYRVNGDIDYRAEMDGIWLHGKLEQRLADGTVVTWQFEHGRIVSRNGEPLSCGLFDALAAGQVDSQLAVSLGLSGVRVYAASAREELEFFGEDNGIAIEIDRPMDLTWVEEPFFPCMGIDCASMLVLKARAMGRECDYRNGKVWIRLRDAEKQQELDRDSAR
jgi:hypothetical protein